MTRILALLAALAGSAAGAAIVLADEPAATPAPTVAAPRRPAQASQPPVAASDVAIDVTKPDPRGGPEWVIRRFTSDRPESKCAELGRIVGGRFGWIDGYGTFRPAEPGHHQTPELCMPPPWLEKIRVQTFPLTTVVYPHGRAPQPSRGVMWGLAAPGVTAVKPDGEAALATTPYGSFLAVSTTPSEFPQAGETIAADGSSRRYDFLRGFHPPGGRPAPGTARVAAIAPDPAGGQPWAILAAETPKGGPCFSQPGRLLGHRLGDISVPDDTFRPAFEFLGCTAARTPTRAYPMRLTTGIYGRGRNDAATQGRIERRTLLGRTVISGRVHPDVRSVTLTTPRDVRTLVPSKTGGFILAAYDGTFPTGTVTATAHLKDGRTVTRSVYIG